MAVPCPSIATAHAPLLSLIAIAVVTAATADLDALPRPAWGQARSDERHTGWAPVVGAAQNVRAWSTPVGGHIGTYQTATIGFTNDVLIGADLAAGGSRLISLDGASGAARWNVTTGGTIAGAVAVGPCGFGPPCAFVSAGDGSVTAVRAATGAVVWTHALGGSLSSPSLSRGVLYVGCTDARVRALDAATGRELWATNASAAVLSTPAVHHGAVFVTTQGGDVLALGAATGRVRWRVNVAPAARGATVPDPVVGDTGVVFVATGDSRVHALHGADGTQLWLSPAVLTRGDVGTPALDDARGRIFVGSQTMPLYCLDAASGAILWSFQWFPGEGITGAPAVDGAGVVFVSVQGSGGVYALNGTSGATLSATGAVGNGWQITGPVLGGDGTVFVASAGSGSTSWASSVFAFAPPAAASGALSAGSAEARPG